MIDIILNDTGGLVLAHDDKALDGFNLLEIAADGGATLRGPSGDRRLGALRPAMMEMISEGMPGRAVRMSGWRMAKVSPLSVRILH